MHAAAAAAAAAVAMWAWCCLAFACVGEAQLLRGRGAARRIMPREHSVDSGFEYVGYLVPPPARNTRREGWVCGASVITPLWALTSAACVKDGPRLLLVTGTRKYWPARLTLRRPCASHARKIVRACFVKGYDMSRVDQVKWMTHDIAVIKAERRIEYDEGCTFTPKPVKMDFSTPLSEILTKQLVAVGFGHDRNVNYNQLNSSVRVVWDENAPLHWTSVRAISRERCLEALGPRWAPTVERALCTSDEVAGVCQNDHGGPLVRPGSTRRGRDALVAVIAGSRVNLEMKCVPPYLYTHLAEYRHLLLCSDMRRHCARLRAASSADDGDVCEDWPDLAP